MRAVPQHPRGAGAVPQGMGVVTESQNIQGWKGPLWVTQPNPLLKQGHPQQAAQHHVQAGLEYLQRRRLHNLPGQPVPVVQGDGGDMICSPSKGGCKGGSTYSAGPG